MRITIATTKQDGSLKTPEEINAEALIAARHYGAIHCYSVRVNGKPIGTSDDLPGLHIERARVLYAELLDSANRTDTVFLSPVRYKSFGIYKRENGAWVPVKGCQYSPPRREVDRNRRPMWVR